MNTSFGPRNNRPNIFRSKLVGNRESPEQSLREAIVTSGYVTPNSQLPMRNQAGGDQVQTFKGGSIGEIRADSVKKHANQLEDTLIKMRIQEI